MKVFLMHRDRDTKTEAAPAWNERDVTQDLELETLLDAMADGDPFLRDVARRALFVGLNDPEAIGYRQDVLRDFLAHPALLAELYSIAVEATVKELRHALGRLLQSPENTLHRSTLDLKTYVRLLPRLRLIAEEHADDVGSEGLSRFFRMLTTELDDDYFREVGEHLQRLEYHREVNMSARLGEDLSSAGFVLHERAVDTRGWRERFAFWKRQSFTYRVEYNDERALRAVADLRAQGVILVADAVAQSAEHIFDFFEALRTELAFFLACLNLHDRLEAQGNPTCIPVPGGAGLALNCEGLYDPCLALTMGGTVVGNDVDARDAQLVVVTGANQGGKSTFLRSVGVAQLMVRAGMFAPAIALELSPSAGVFTHFRREEDATMTSGKLDEEFTRMSSIADHLAPGDLVLFNESFSATNEREGSHVSREMIHALIESGIHVVFVTHLYDLAHGLHAEGKPGAVFLRANRDDDGRRTFRLVEGEPLPTSFGRDVYERVFGTTEEQSVPSE